MNEQAKQQTMSTHSKTSNFEESVQSMIARVMSLARLLTTEDAAPDASSAELKRARRKKHKNENS